MQNYPTPNKLQVKILHKRDRRLFHNDKMSHSIRRYSNYKCIYTQHKNTSFEGNITKLRGRIKTVGHFNDLIYAGSIIQTENQ